MFNVNVSLHTMFLKNEESLLLTKRSEKNVTAKQLETQTISENLPATH